MSEDCLRCDGVAWAYHSCSVPAKPTQTDALRAAGELLRERVGDIGCKNCPPRSTACQPCRAAMDAWDTAIRSLIPPQEK